MLLADLLQDGERIRIDPRLVLSQECVELRQQNGSAWIAGRSACS